MTRALLACLWLIATVTKNRVKAAVRRLATPRYLVGAIVAAAYLWFLLVMNPAFAGGAAGQEGPRPGFAVMLRLMFLFHLLLVWLTAASGKGGVALRECEVEALFPSPITRRSILVYKALQMQVPILFSGLFIALFVRRFGDVGAGKALASYWLAANFLNAHGMFAGLLLAAWKEKGGVLARFVRVPGVLFLLFFAFSLGAAWDTIGGFQGAGDFVRLLDTRWMTVCLSPVEPFVRPFMSAPGEFMPAAALAAGLVLLQWALILVPDFRFEESTLRIAAKIGRIRTEGLDALRDPVPVANGRGAGRIGLAPTGPIWRAIVWKNVRSITRLPRRAWIGAIFGLAVMAFVFSRFDAGLELGRADQLGFILLIVGAYGSFLAPSMLRVDLRIDIPHFDMLKALPIRAFELVLGEVMGTLVIVFSIQAGMFGAAAILIDEAGGEALAWSLKLPALAALLAVVFAFDFCVIGGENLMALWFPGFVRLGRGLKTGIDQFGQNLVGAIVRIFAVVLLMVLPGAAAFLVTLLLGDRAAPGLVMLAAALPAAALLVGQMALLMALSSGRYRRFDLSREHAVEDA